MLIGVGALKGANMVSLCSFSPKHFSKGLSFYFPRESFQHANNMLFPKEQAPFWHVTFQGTGTIVWLFPKRQVLTTGVYMLFPKGEVLT